jgi:hypothetical protein
LGVATTKIHRNIDLYTGNRRGRAREAWKLMLVSSGALKFGERRKFGVAFFYARP